MGAPGRAAAYPAHGGGPLHWGMPLERELKYSLLDPYAPAPVELEAAFEAAPFTAAELHEQRVIDRYFDDDRRSLKGAGMALRQRSIDGRHLATLKTRGSVDGALHERDELELPSDHRGWPAAIVDRLRGVVRPEDLRPLLEVHALRRRFRVTEGDVAVALLSFDAVEARAPDGEHSAHFDEVEIEAAEGVPAATLEAIAERLGQVVALTATGTTKLERAEALLPLMPW